MKSWMAFALHAGRPMVHSRLATLASLAGVATLAGVALIAACGGATAVDDLNGSGRSAQTGAPSSPGSGSGSGCDDTKEGMASYGSSGGGETRTISNGCRTSCPYDYECFANSHSTCCAEFSASGSSGTVGYRCSDDSRDGAGASGGYGPPCSGLRMHCDEPADCAGGARCFIALAAGEDIFTARSACLTTAPTSGLELCKTDGDCSGGGPCRELTCNGVMLRTCNAGCP